MSEIMRPYIQINERQERIETPEKTRIKWESRRQRKELNEGVIWNRVEQLIGKDGIKQIERFFWLNETGVYTKELSRKVFEFQQTNWLIADGYAGKKTLLKIQEKTPKWFFETIFWRNIETPSNQQEAEKRFNEKMKNEKWISHIESKPTSTEKVRWNVSELNKQFVENNAPWGWKNILSEFAGNLRTNEILSQETPILLVDSASRTWTKAPCIYMYQWRVQRLTVTLWWGGTTLESQRKTKDGKTPIKMIHRFNNIRIWKNADEITANTKTNGWVVSASLQSDYSWKNGYRYFHGLPTGLDYTLWCVGFDKEEIRPIAQDVQRALSKRNQAFWYVS
jgi:hypothetical protein